jgi:Rrf2 family protein
MVLVNEIARAVEAPPLFLAKIFQQFGKLGLVRSFRGSGGGFRLGRTPEEITLCDIVEAVEGPIMPNRCVMSRGICSRDKFCPVHPVWKKLQENMRETLGAVTLRDLSGKS